MSPSGITKTPFLFPFCLLAGLLLVSCSAFSHKAPILGSTASPSPSGLGQINDSQITLAVWTELMNDEAVAGHLINVETEQGIVTLTGLVDNLLAKARATKIAESIKGVRAVINRITVETVVRPDHEISKDVKQALLLDPATDSYEVNVTVRNGVVTLMGWVQSWQEKQLCNEVARGVRGVRAVRDLIQVYLRGNRLDREIQADIKRRLKSDVWVDASLIDVNVTNGKAILSGMVRTASEKRRASEAAWVAGVSSVDDSALAVYWLLSERSTVHKAYGVTVSSDRELARAVRDAFLYDPRICSADPQVEVVAGIVTLTGMVNNLKAKKAAEQDARNTVGVRRVKNHLRVRPQRWVPDDELRQDVLRALRRDVFLGRNNFITVSVKNATVYLYGMVHSNYEKSRAEDITSRVKGVVAVQNGLGVYSVWTKKSDWEILQDIEDQFRWDPLVNDEAIEVTVTDGEATLTGSVDTWTERQLAIENAYEGGAKQVHDCLTVREHSFREPS